MESKYFSPSCDQSALDAAPVEATRDVCFIGSFSRHHTARAAVLERVARLAAVLQVDFFLLRSLITQVAQLPMFGPLLLRRYRMPLAISAVASEPVFGDEAILEMKRSRVVINGGIDGLVGKYRGNMRCFETLSVGTPMVTDAGIYPEGMVEGVHYLSYDNPEQAVNAIAKLIDDPTYANAIASAGLRLMQTDYSKTKQWEYFKKLL